jgi:hypothetical protein
MALSAEGAANVCGGMMACWKLDHPNQDPFNLFVEKIARFT